MTAGSWPRRGRDLLAVLALGLWLALAATPAAAEDHLAEPASEPADAEAAVTPSSAAGTSLLVAAVVGTLWHLGIAERRRDGALRR